MLTFCANILRIFLNVRTKDVDHNFERTLFLLSGLFLSTLLPFWSHDDECGWHAM